MTPVDCSLPGSSVHGISQARVLEWVAISFSRGSSWPRDWTCISCVGRQILYHWATREAQTLLWSSICMTAVPCTSVWVERGGCVTPKPRLHGARELMKSHFCELLSVCLCAWHLACLNLLIPHMNSIRQLFFFFWLRKWGTEKSISLQKPHS